MDSATSVGNTESLLHWWRRSGRPDGKSASMFRRFLLQSAYLLIVAAYFYWFWNKQPIYRSVPKALHQYPLIAVLFLIALPSLILAEVVTKYMTYRLFREEGILYKRGWINPTAAIRDNYEHHFGKDLYWKVQPSVRAVIAFGFIAIFVSLLLSH